MKIVSLAAENIKRLVAVEVTPTGNMVQITGRNGSGKTSLLDSIWWALAGAGVAQPVPIRTGETSARIRLDLGEIIVTRTFKKTEGGAVTTAITVENADGARFPSPQRMLDDLLGSLSFDPLAFARMAPREQFNELRRFVPGVDFDAIEAANKADYATRTDVNRRAKEEHAAAGPVIADAPDAEVDESALVDELQMGAQNNAALERRLAQVRADELAEVRVRADAADLLAKAENLRAAVEHEKADIGDSQPVDLTVLRQRIEQAKTARQRFDMKVARSLHLRNAANLEEKAEALTAAMAKREADKVAAVAAAKMPVPGLGLADGAVTLDGVPFEQASDAEKLKVSVALAMASNPKLRVVRVRDGSLLDAESLQLLGDMADTFDMQVWIEKVSDGERVGFVIEDGRLKAEE
jgi:energy-coupling factor transporter ATP-binding protein EcfA2